MIRYGSLFSGCGLMDLGIERAGLRCLWKCEIDKQARRALSRHWPDVPCHEDVRGIGKQNLNSVDVIAGGFPCQSVSVAGNRGGLADRGKSGLFYEMARICGELRPKIVLAENVPGLLSSDAGRDFGRIVLEMAKCGYRQCAWRILDARFFGVPQRRRRVFIVWARDDLGDGIVAEILALSQGCERHPAESGGAGKKIAATLGSRSANTGVSRPGRGGEDDENLIFSSTLTGGSAGGKSHGKRSGSDRQTLAIATLNYGNKKGGFRTEPGEHIIVSALGSAKGGADDNAAQANHIVPACFNPDRFFQKDGSIVDGFKADNVADALHGPTGNKKPLIFETRIGRNGRGQPSDVAHALRGHEAGGTSDCRPMLLAPGQIVRRLMPVECLRLMGAPDDWLEVEPPLSDSAKYRLCGNGVVVLVAEWLGKRTLRVLNST